MGGLKKKQRDRAVALVTVLAGTTIKVYEFRNYCEGRYKNHFSARDLKSCNLRPLKKWFPALKKQN